MNVTPPVMDRTQTSAAELRFVELPKKFWSFESLPITIELSNHCIQELNQQDTLERVVINLDLLDTEGNPYLNIHSKKVPIPVSMGSTQRISVSPFFRVFEGNYRMRITLFRKTEEHSEFALLPTPPEFVDIEITPTIHEAFLELTNICNFRCTFCPQGELQRPAKMMDLELVKKVFKDLAEMGHHHPIRLHLLGEPTLYKRFEDVIHAAHDVGLKLVLATNGSRLNEKNTEMIFRAGLDEILISLNTPEQQDYDSQRGSKMSFDQYVQGICNFVAERAARGGPPKTRINILYDMHKKDHPDEQARIRRIVASWAAMIEKRTGKHIPELDRVPELIVGQEVSIELLEGLEFQWTAYHQWGLGQNPMTTFCRLPWFQLVVLADGNVSACCVDAEGEIVLGNAFRQSIAEIWRGPELTRIRKNFLKGRPSTARCARCDVYHNKSDLFPVS